MKVRFVVNDYESALCAFDECVWEYPLQEVQLIDILDLFVGWRCYD